MKQIILTLFAVFGLLTFNSCKKDESTPKPTAEFTFTGGGCTAPCAVLFDNTSKDATSYSWNFGDGTNSSDKSPTKTYNTGGTYTVQLTATGSGGASTTSKQILIQQSVQAQLPVANFTFSGNGTAPSTVSFSNTSTNATGYNWDFGDGSSSTSLNPTHTYTTGGAFSVILTATNSAGNNQITKIVNITAPPTKVKITKVTVTDLPFLTSGGASWDFSGGPDVFFNITNQLNNILLNGTTSRISDVTSAMLPLSWTLTSAYEITDFGAARYIDLWDFDSPDADDYIGYVGFLMSNYTSAANPYPATVTQTQNGITVKLDLIWQ